MSLRVTVNTDTSKAQYPCIRKGNLSQQLYLCMNKDTCYKVEPDGTLRVKSSKIEVNADTTPFIGTVTLTSE